MVAELPPQRPSKKPLYRFKKKRNKRPSAVKRRRNNSPRKGKLPNLIRVGLSGQPLC
jgi:hypothetical protein